MASGILKSLSFTPGEDGVVQITITCEAQGTAGGDWGSSIYLKAFATQSGTTYGDSIPVSSTDRLPTTIQEYFDVTGGSSVTCGLYGDISGAVALTVWNVKIVVKVYKR